MYKGGLFSPPVVLAVGDPYIDASKRDRHGHGACEKQFGIGKGIPGKFNRLYEGEGYKSLSKIASEERMKGRAGFLTPTGFAHSSPNKKSVSSGDFYGTFEGKPFPYIPDGKNGTRGPRSPFNAFENRKIYTSPAKRSMGHGCEANTPKIMFQEFAYVESPYDAARQQERVIIYVYVCRIHIDVGKAKGDESIIW